MPRITIMPASGDPRMDCLDNDNIDLLSRCIKLVDKNLDLDTIDYASGCITVSITYNRGIVDEEWVKHDFIRVNVVCDSVPAIFKDVYQKVYDRCMH